ncbi:MAG: hypothetical protein KK482_26365 [Sinorhizobium meliloti]|nr:hypothetical protein [Sinorhizobium meliloti]
MELGLREMTGRGRFRARGCSNAVTANGAYCSFLTERYPEAAAAGMVSPAGR